MKKIAICFGLFFLFGNNAQSQELIIKGRIRCINTTDKSTKGAENIVVVPTFQPSLATITASRPSGYFEMNTGVPLANLQDKMVTVYVLSRCADCPESARRVFISEDQDRQNRDDTKQYVTIKDWMLNTNCQMAELAPFAADSILSLVVEQPGMDLEEASPMAALSGTPVFLNFLTTLTPVLGALPNSGDFQLYSLEQGNISYGQFLMSSPMSHSANTGFNFSPSRDLSEAVFWNPSAISFSNKPGNISLLTNVKNNVKLGGFYKINDQISLSAGGIYSVQDERRQSVFVRAPGSDPNDNLRVDSLQMKLKEYAVFISPVYKVNNQFSMGVTLKSVWQDFNVPHRVSIRDVDGASIGTFTDSTFNNQYFDVDISATYKLTNALQVGLNLMNLAGTELYADAFVPGRPYAEGIPRRNLRSLGLGIIYKWQRLNVGADMLFTEDELYDASLGVNFVPFNNALLSGGFAVKQMSYSFAFRLKNFRIAYINDNELLVNEKRAGKSKIFHGKIYGGFIFDLN
jgi:hypothetical protein